jgi:hypothetical protein
MNKDEAANLAEECGAFISYQQRTCISGLPDYEIQIFEVKSDQLLAFANACEKIGVEEAEERAAILQDSAYVAGMKFGWNCCCNDNSAAFEKAIEDRINERVQLRAHKE